MSRSGYVDDYDDYGSLNLYRANVARTIGGKRGQAFLREMAASLDAMPVKELVAEEVVRDSEHVCAMGSVALARGLDVSNIDPEDPDTVARVFGITRILACEIAYMNDECAPTSTRDDAGKWKKLPPETPAERWVRMRKWVDENIRKSEE